MKAANKQLEEWDKELTQLHERNGDLGLEVQNLREQLASEQRDRKKLEDSVSAVVEFPKPTDLLKQLKQRREKSRTTLADVEVILQALKTWLTVEHQPAIVNDKEDC